MEFHMINITYAAYARTNKKDDIYMQRRLVQRLLYIDEAHTALDIFRFEVFFFILAWILLKSV